MLIMILFHDSGYRCLKHFYQEKVCLYLRHLFKGIAQRGKCSMGWFFGFKLHLICNEKGELLNFMITPGDVDDRKPLEYKEFVELIYGKLVADKGYISKNLFQRLFVDGIQLITKLKSNMKGALMSVSDKLLLRKRAIIETVFVIIAIARTVSLGIRRVRGQRATSHFS